MKALNISETIAAYLDKMNDSSKDFCKEYDVAYNTQYICDAITEFADANTSIYYADIEKFISENVDAVNDAIAEFGWDGCGADLYKAGQIAECLQIENEIFSDLGYVVRVLALDYLSGAGRPVSCEMWEDISEALENIETNDMLDTICDVVNDITNTQETA